MTAALVAGGPVTLPEVEPFVDGAAVKRIGDVPYAVVSQLGARWCRTRACRWSRTCVRKVWVTLRSG